MTVEFDDYNRDDLETLKNLLMILFDGDEKKVNRFLNAWVCATPQERKEMLKNPQNFEKWFTVSKITGTLMNTFQLLLFNLRKYR